MSDARFTVRPAGERGVTELGWLSSRHSFSFGGYADPDHMGFRSLRVINDDRVRPGQGFGTHAHRDMEIISIVVEGALEHRDSMGNGSVIRPGDVQRMSAGTGVTHSEFNPSAENGVRFLQIWIVPEARGIEPGYEQKTFDVAGEPDRWLLVASRDGRDGSLTVHQDIDLYRAVVRRGSQLEYRPTGERHLWLQVISGSLDLDGASLHEGDGVALSGDAACRLAGVDGAGDVLLFDLA